MDIATLVPKNKTIEITHPGTGENLGIRVVVRSPESDPVREYHRARARDGAAADGAEFAAAVIASWDWYGEDISFKGSKSPKLDAETLRDLFKTLPWFENQIFAPVGDARSFFQS